MYTQSKHMESYCLRVNFSHTCHQENQTPTPTTILPPTEPVTPPLTPTEPPPVEPPTTTEESRARQEKLETAINLLRKTFGEVLEELKKGDEELMLHWGQTAFRLLEVLQIVSF